MMVVGTEVSINRNGGKRLDIDVLPDQKQGAKKSKRGHSVNTTHANLTPKTVRGVERLTSVIRRHAGTGSIDTTEKRYALLYF